MLIYLKKRFFCEKKSQDRRKMTGAEGRNLGIDRIEFGFVDAGKDFAEVVYLVLKIGCDLGCEEGLTAAEAFKTGNVMKDHCAGGMLDCVGFCAGLHVYVALGTFHDESIMFFLKNCDGKTGKGRKKTCHSSLPDRFGLCIKERGII